MQPINLNKENLLDAILNLKDPRRNEKGVKQYLNDSSTRSTILWNVQNYEIAPWKNTSMVTKTSSKYVVTFSTDAIRTDKGIFLIICDLIFSDQLLSQGKISIEFAVNNYGKFTTFYEFDPRSYVASKDITMDEGLRAQISKMSQQHGIYPSVFYSLIMWLAELLSQSLKYLSPNRQSASIPQASISPPTIPHHQTTAPVPIQVPQSGGGRRNHHRKYMKYKAKYLSLKKN